MSDEQPPEVGSRRRRREIREARERERAAERERESTVRRLSTSTTASEPQSPALFDQEELERRRRRGEPVTGASGRVPQRPASSAASADAAGAASRRARREQQEQERQAALEKRRAEQQKAEQEAAERAAAQRAAGFYAGSGLDAGWDADTSAPQPKPSAPASQQQAQPVQRQQPQSPRPTPQAQPEPRVSEQKPSAASPQRPKPEPQVRQKPEPRQTPAQPQQTEDPNPTRAIPSAVPSTPFEDVVAGSPSDAGPEQEPVEEEFDGQDFHALEGFEGLDWEDFEDQQIEHDENGAPVLVAASDYGRGYQTVQPMEGRMSLTALKAKKAKRRRRNITLFLFLGVFAAMVIGVVAVVRSFLGTGEDEITDYEQASGAEIEFEVRDGDGFETVGNRLVQEEIVASWDALSSAYQAADAEEDLGSLQPGTYPMQEQMPAEEAIAALYDMGPEQHVVYVGSGQWESEIFEAIAEATPHTVQDLEAAAEDPQQYNLPEEAESLEGYLAPGEYSWDVDADVTPEEILQDMVDATFERLEDIGIEDEEEQWETVIIASLITAEANHNDPDSYEIMSGAIQNRLDPDNTETDGYLQIDATNNYALGAHDIHGATALDSDDPYNSYTQPGLPPGPVGAPLRATLEAAANPADVDYYYWVTVNLETGETEFTETYAQHQVYVEEFLQWCDDNPGYCGSAEVEAAEEEAEE